MVPDNANALYKIRAGLQTHIKEAERKIGELNHAIAQTRAILVILDQRDLKHANYTESVREAKPMSLTKTELEQMTIQDLTAVRDRIDTAIRQKGAGPEHGKSHSKSRK